VGDGGTLAELDSLGTLIEQWDLSGLDVEGITIADPLTDVVYIGVEHPDSVVEFDLATGSVLRTFDLTATLVGPDNAGLEGLTFVSDAANPQGGVFYAALQDDGRIYVFDLPIVSSATDTTVLHIDTLTPVVDRSDLSGLHYNALNDTLYGTYDSSDLITAMDTQGVLIQEWTLPGNDQEGIAIDRCELYIAEDVGPEVWHYTGWDGDPTDSDADGVSDCVDVCPGTAAGLPVETNGCECGAGPAEPTCGNGVCEASDGEDCLSCEEDCNGKQSGKPTLRYCCGDATGSGTNYVDCSDAQCSAGGETCSYDPPVGGSCCGDGICELGEDSCSCDADCGLPAASESSGTDGLDNDCDSLVDCDDTDCDADEACQPAACDGNGVCDPGEDCSTCSSDCDGVQKGKPAKRYCCGNGVTEGPEAGGDLCDGND
jgi:hypothetical protein